VEGVDHCCSVQARWGVAIVLATMSAVVAVAALAVLASPAFREITDSYVRVALTGVVPALAILAVASAATASSRVLKAPWGAALLGVLGLRRAESKVYNSCSSPDIGWPQHDRQR